ncbi:DnaJ-like protein [Thermosporothrix hazakensis]|jgi:predicted nucleic acid-binding Zn ribbon protein/DNA-directed RNA polymerase subunit RPC12/RpoP|uniref:DnaJ-like protein n=2 Tax=Thermosporothrix TaxID=768650 RepID=A0A326U2D4_THEHA|nr:DnaJ domain-containing protein [Thermosporothrix hazakensis]PZW25434.1 DnaJ-like protein [Thermosporothrix hazakensis]BBH90770.1 hypothetical protein KTC_55210 [Thermosporothrix sp. COM3]GCE48819.1 hypothetical protein KTH_36880 [Thermosporothrix hazakensis]
MHTSPDYYTLLGVPQDASPEAIKAAFKKLALKYHPDVYKGEDAHTRMRLLLEAYQTLNDPAMRKKYDEQRAQHTTGSFVPHTPYEQTQPPRQKTREVTPEARRDRQRYYDFPEFHVGQKGYIDLIECSYILTPAQTRMLVLDGLVRGTMPRTTDGRYYCHRCHHHWSTETPPLFCPQCHASDWQEYLLLRCVHCSAVFESEQLRNEIGSISYGKQKNTLCHPYELFPLCPYCGAARWCPSENRRVNALQRRATRFRFFWFSILLLALLISVLFVAGVVR